MPRASIAELDFGLQYLLWVSFLIIYCLFFFGTAYNFSRNSWLARAVLIHLSKKSPLTPIIEDIFPIYRFVRPIIRRPLYRSAACVFPWFFWFFFMGRYFIVLYYAEPHEYFFWHIHMICFWFFNVCGFAMKRPRRYDLWLDLLRQFVDGVNHFSEDLRCVKKDFQGSRFDKDIRLGIFLITIILSAFGGISFFQGFLELVFQKGKNTVRVWANIPL